MWCFELQYHSLFSLSVVIWRWFIMKNSDCRKWLICKWANKNGQHQISRWWLMNLNVGWLLRVKPAWFWTVSSGSSGCFAAVGELWFPKLMDDNLGWNTCCPWYMCTAFTTTSGCICRVCKCGQTLSYPLLFHCLEMRLPFCLVFLVWHVHCRTTGKQKRAAHTSSDCIRKMTKLVLKRSLSVLIWFYTLFSFPELMMTVAELYQHNADTRKDTWSFQKTPTDVWFCFTKETVSVGIKKSSWFGLKELFH